MYLWLRYSSGFFPQKFLTTSRVFTGEVDTGIIQWSDLKPTQNLISKVKWRTSLDVLKGNEKNVLQNTISFPYAEKIESLERGVEG